MCVASLDGRRNTLYHRHTLQATIYPTFDAQPRLHDISENSDPGSLHWRHVSFMPSDITGNSTVGLAASSDLCKIYQAHTTGPLGGEPTGDRWC